MFKQIKVLTDSQDKEREPFLSKSQKVNSKIIPKSDHAQTWNVMPVGAKMVAKLIPKTHQQSMPKLVTENIIKVIKIHVFPNGKII